MNLILVDSSVWIAHFRLANPVLQSLLAADLALCHPLVLLEIACGTPPAPRSRTLAHLKTLQQAVVATTDEILSLVENKRCYDTGCGATDVALLASTLLMRNTRLWTMDKDLAALAARLNVAFDAEVIQSLPK